MITVMPCSGFIAAIREQSFETHARGCLECQAFIEAMGSMNATDQQKREYICKLSEQLTGDPTEIIRALEREKLNTRASEREHLESMHEKVWNTSELQQDFHVISFLAPYVLVRRKTDGKKGTLKFQHMPRYYFDWCEE